MEWSRRTAEGLQAAARAFSNPALRRLEVAWFVSVTADLATTVALGVYAFQEGGAAGVGVAALLRLLPSAVAAPILALPGDRFPRERVLMTMEGLRGCFVVAAGVGAALGWPALAVYGLMAAAAVASSALRSIQFALLPALATAPDELVAANVGLATIEGLGGLLGPAIGGIFLAVFGPAVVLAGGGMIFVLAAILIGTIRVPVRFARGGPSTRPLVEALEGVRTIATERDPRLVVGLFFAQTVVRGALAVFIVVTSIELLDLGEQGVGYLTAMIGVGGLVGAVVTLSLVGRPQLARWFGVGLVLWGLPLVLLAGSGVAIVAYVAMAIVGIGNNLTDVAGMTLLQRIVEDRLLARVLGALDGIVLAGAALGAAVAPPAIDALGARGALATLGAALIVLVGLAQPGLRRLDRIASVPVEAVLLLRRVPMFAALDIPTIDHLARVAVPMSVAAGTVLIREGDHGDRVYVIDGGSFEVVRGGTQLAILGEGDAVGEIALLKDVPRTATVTAREDAQVLAVDRDHFLQAVTGFALSLEEAHRTAEARTGQHA